MKKMVPWLIRVFSLILCLCGFAGAEQDAAKAMFSGLNNIMGKGHHTPLTLPDNWQELLLRIGLPGVGGIIVIFIAIKIIKSMGEEKPKPVPTYKPGTPVDKKTAQDIKVPAVEAEKKESESDDLLTKEAEELVSEFMRQSSEKK